MIEVECAQLSPEWWEARRGIPTASEFARIMTPTKRQASASQEKYIAELLADITCLNPKYFTGQGGPVNAATEYGRITEGKARRYFEMQTKIPVRQVGFCKTDDGRFGCSPDGLPDPDAILEIKCPMRVTHLMYLMKGVVPTEYLCQVHGEMIVTGRRLGYFLSYCEGEDPLLLRVEPDDFTMALRTHLELFSVKFEAAKKRFRVRNEDEVDTEECKAKVREWGNDLAAIEGDVHDGKIDEEAAVARVNAKLPDLKKYEHDIKRAVYKLLTAWIAKRPQPWFLDRVNLIYRLKEDEEF